MNRKENIIIKNIEKKKEYFTRFPNEYIQGNIKTKFGVSRKFYITYILIDKYRSYEDYSWITIRKVLDFYGYKTHRNKPKAFKEILDVLEYMINNQMIEVKQDLDSLSYDTGIEIKIIPKNFDSTEKFAKLTSSQFDKYLNPTGSVKDRAAKGMIEDAEKKGLLKKGSVIIEPTSGNTGIGLASIAVIKGYRVILTMPETMSIERRNILKAYGAELVLTDGKKGMSGAIEKAEELAKEIENSFIPAQFDNAANAEIHKKTTGVEIWNDTDGSIDYFIAGVGTGGTLTGTGEYLKSKKDNIHIVAVEPADSPVLSQSKSGTHAIQGIGAGFVPKVLNTSIYDSVFAVESNDAFESAKKLAKTEGILVGISSGAALHAGITLAEQEQNKDKVIVVLLPDSADRYYSTELFQ